MPPLHKRSRKEQKLCTKPWLSKKILQSIKEKTKWLGIWNICGIFFSSRTETLLWGAVWKKNYLFCEPCFLSLFRPQFVRYIYRKYPTYISDKLYPKSDQKTHAKQVGYFRLIYRTNCALSRTKKHAQNKSDKTFCLTYFVRYGSYELSQTKSRSITWLSWCAAQKAKIINLEVTLNELSWSSVIKASNLKVVFVWHTIRVASEY